MFLRSKIKDVQYQCRQSSQLLRKQSKKQVKKSIESITSRNRHMTYKFMSHLNRLKQHKSTILRGSKFKSISISFVLVLIRVAINKRKCWNDLNRTQIWKEKNRSKTSAITSKVSSRPKLYSWNKEKRVIQFLV